MPSPSSRVIIAAAGARKTQEIIDIALSDATRSVLITTYTNENRSQIVRRIVEAVGSLPSNVEVIGWFSFLLNQCARPYQRALTESPGRIRGIDFHGQRSRFTKSTDIQRYFFDKKFDMYRDAVSDFVCRVNAASHGAVIARLERIYDLVLVDEMQDLVGYDLDVLELLFGSSIQVVAVGDPRQHTFSTNQHARNKQFRGPGILKWIEARSSLCELETWTANYRCNQTICDFGDALFPEMPRSQSMMTVTTGHDGIICVNRSAVDDYVASFSPTILRDSRKFDTADYPAMNIGVAKGSTFDRVLIFPTKPMLEYLKHQDPDKLKSRERLYVAVTRARYSVAFVLPDQEPRAPAKPQVGRARVEALNSRPLRGRAAR